MLQRLQDSSSAVHNSLKWRVNAKRPVSLTYPTDVVILHANLQPFERLRQQKLSPHWSRHRRSFRRSFGRPWNLPYFRSFRSPPQCRHEGPAMNGWRSWREICISINMHIPHEKITWHMNNMIHLLGDLIHDPYVVYLMVYHDIIPLLPSFPPFIHQNYGIVSCTTIQRPVGTCRMSLTLRRTWETIPMGPLDPLSWRWWICSFSTVLVGYNFLVLWEGKYTKSIKKA